MMTSSPGFTSAAIVALMASLAPQVTTISRAGSTVIAFSRASLRAIASRKSGSPWLAV